MKGKKPMMIMASGIGSKRRPKEDKREEMEEMDDDDEMKAGGMTYANGGMTRGGRDGCAVRGKTKGRMV